MQFLMLFFKMNATCLMHLFCGRNYVQKAYFWILEINMLTARQILPPVNWVLWFYFPIAAPLAVKKQVFQLLK